MKLQNLFAMGIFSAGALGLGAMVADRTILTRAILRERLESRGRAVAESIGTLALPQLRSRRPLDRKAMLLFARLPSVEYVVIRDRDGRQVYEESSDPAESNREDSVSRLPVQYEVLDGGAVLGTVRVGLSLTRVHAESHEVLVRGLLMAVVVLALLAVLSWFMGRALGRQLGRFTQALIRLDPRYGSQKTGGLLRRSELTAVWGAFRDLHARLEEEEHKRARVERLKNDLAGMIVHDLKQPLTVLQSVLMMIRDPRFGSSAEDAAVNPLAMADRALMRLNAMIEEVLQIARMNDAEAPLARQRLSIRGFLEECAEENRFIVEHSGRVFRCSIDASVGSRWIHGDKPLLHRMIGNLVMNAVEHSPPGGPVTLGARLTGEADKAAVFVHNEGASIAKGQIAKLFDKYATSGEGLRNVGLGLAFCNLVAKRHDATLSGESDPGRGTTFTLVMHTSAFPMEPVGAAGEKADGGPAGVRA